MVLHTDTSHCMPLQCFYVNLSDIYNGMLQTVVNITENLLHTSSTLKKKNLRTNIQNNIYQVQIAKFTTQNSVKNPQCNDA